MLLDGITKTLSLSQFSDAGEAMACQRRTVLSSNSSSALSLVLSVQTQSPAMDLMERWWRTFTGVSTSDFFLSYPNTWRILSRYGKNFPHNSSKIGLSDDRHCSSAALFRQSILSPPKFMTPFPTFLKSRLGLIHQLILWGRWSTARISC